VRQSRDVKFALTPIQNTVYPMASPNPSFTHRVQDVFLCVRSQIYAILRVQKMRGDSEVDLAVFAGRKKRMPITRFICALREKEIVARQSKKTPSELLLPARVVNRFPSLSAIHINTSVFRSVHHQSQLPLFHSFFSLISFFCVVRICYG
jgi:hypothetical protein